MQKDDKYIKQLEETIKKFMAPLKDIPFPVAIKAISGYKVIPFDKKDENDKALLKKLSEAAFIAGKEAYNKGVKSGRPNEVGNYIEPFVKKALLEVKLQADIPKNKMGKRQSAGYPDIEIIDVKNRIAYLECKTYNLKNVNTTQRSFYFSPSRRGCKITADARHLVLSYQMEQVSGGIYAPVRWCIYTIDSLFVELKHEFNAANRQIYREEALLAEGKI